MTDIDVLTFRNATTGVDSIILNCDYVSIDQVSRLEVMYVHHVLYMLANYIGSGIYTDIKNMTYTYLGNDNIFYNVLGIPNTNYDEINHQAIRNIFSHFPHSKYSSIMGRIQRGGYNNI